jgi:hypothetical protein
VIERTEKVEDAEIAFYQREDLNKMANKKQFVTAAAAFAVTAAAVAPAMSASAAMPVVKLGSDYVRQGNLDAALDKKYHGSEIHWYKSSVNMNKLGVFQTAVGFVKGKGIKVEKRIRVLNYAQEVVGPKEMLVFEKGEAVSGIRTQPVKFADRVYMKPGSWSGIDTSKVGEFMATFTYTNKAYGTVSKSFKYKVVESAPMVSSVKLLNAKELEINFSKPVDASTLLYNGTRNASKDFAARSRKTAKHSSFAPRRHSMAATLCLLARRLKDSTVKRSYRSKKSTRSKTTYARSSTTLSTLKTIA